MKWLAALLPMMLLVLIAVSAGSQEALSAESGTQSNLAHQELAAADSTNNTELEVDLNTLDVDLVNQANETETEADTESKDKKRDPNPFDRHNCCVDKICC